MQLDHASRLIIIGNSGSGKSTLARILAASTGLRVHHLDPIHWERIGLKREPSDAAKLVTQMAARDAWIIEGVFGWLAEIAVPSAMILVWLDLPWGQMPGGSEKPRPLSGRIHGRLQRTADLGARLLDADDILFVRRACGALQWFRKVKAEGAKPQRRGQNGRLLAFNSNPKASAEAFGLIFAGPFAKIRILWHHPQRQKDDPFGMLTPLPFTPKRTLGIGV